MYGEYHPIPYQSKIKEKIISVGGIGLSLSEALWWAAGGILSKQFARIAPPIGTDWMYSRLHQAIPFAICVFLASSRHPATGLSYWKYLFLMFQSRMRQREFVYRKRSIPMTDRRNP